MSYESESKLTFGNILLGLLLLGVVVVIGLIVFVYFALTKQSNNKNTILPTDAPPSQSIDRLSPDGRALPSVPRAQASGKTPNPKRLPMPPTTQRQTAMAIKLPKNSMATTRQSMRVMLPLPPNAQPEQNAPNRFTNPNPNLPLPTTMTQIRQTANAIRANAPSHPPTKLQANARLNPPTNRVLCHAATAHLANAPYNPATAPTHRAAHAMMMRQVAAAVQAAATAIRLLKNH